MTDIPVKSVHAGKPNVENVFLQLDGETFRCECGCDVFRKGDQPQHYVCNSCQEIYLSE